MNKIKKILIIIACVFGIYISLNTLAACDLLGNLFITEKVSRLSNNTSSKTNSSNNNTTRSNSTISTTSLSLPPTETITKKPNKYTTTTTFIRKTTRTNTSTKKLFTTTESTCSHTPTVPNADDRIQYPSFSYYGYIYKSYCNKCGAVLDADLIEPYGTILLTNEDYIKVVDGARVSYTYNIIVDEEDSMNQNATQYRCMLIELSNSSIDGYKIKYFDATLTRENQKSDIFKITYSDQSRSNEYILCSKNYFKFVSSSGNPLNVVTKSHVMGDTSPIYVPREGNTDYGYNFFDNYENDIALKCFYYELYEYAEAIYNSTIDIPLIRDRYMISYIDALPYDLSYDEICAVWSTFIKCSPTYYFISNTISSVNNIPCFLIDESYIFGSTRTAINAGLDEIKEEFLESISESMREKDIVRLAHNYIAQKIDYAWADIDKTIPESASWAHSLTGFVLYNSGVCETYSKAFLYLCSLADIDAIIVSGVASGEGHAWNYVYVNGNWYGVDVTWDDQESGIRNTYLCVGESKIMEDRTVDSYLVLEMGYLYGLPELSKISLPFLF